MLERAVPSPACVVVGVSGGADSMAALGLLLLLRRRLGLTLVVAHVDHGLRRAGGAEAALVAAIARREGLRFTIDRLDLGRGPDLAARARALRRDALRQRAQQHGASALVLAHTATDQAETMLLQLARGTGLAGLAGMPAIEPLKPAAPPRRLAQGARIVRPLLHLTREETRTLAARLALPFVDDPSNEDLRQPRARVRHGLLPLLSALNPAAVRHLANTAEIVAGSLPATDEIAAAPSVLSRRELRACSSAARRRAIRALCRAHGLAADAVPHRVVADIDAALASVSGPRGWDLAGHRRLRADGDAVWIEHTGADGAEPPCAPTGPVVDGSSPTTGRVDAGLQPLTHPNPAAILPEPGRSA